MGITVVAVVLGPGTAGRAGGADGCWLLREELGHLLCKPCSTCSAGQRNISGRIYFNRPNDTLISLRRNVKVR